MALSRYDHDQRQLLALTWILKERIETIERGERNALVLGENSEGLLLCLPAERNLALSGQQ
jgi:hypothetical protein